MCILMLKTTLAPLIRSVLRSPYFIDCCVTYIKHNTKDDLKLSDRLQIRVRSSYI